MNKKNPQIILNLRIFISLSLNLYSSKNTRKSISRILYFRRSACYLSAWYIAATLELITPRFSGRAAPISIAGKNRYTYHCTAKSLPGFTTAELYLLSVALVLPSRVTDVIRFAALWCPDFPTSQTGDQQADFLAGAKIHKFYGKSIRAGSERPEVIEVRRFSNKTFFSIFSSLHDQILRFLLK